METGEKDMKVSIVIPTYNRAGLLRRTLASLARQTGADGDFPGHRRFYVSDPHGNRLEFIERDEAATVEW